MRRGPRERARDMAAKRARAASCLREARRCDFARCLRRRGGLPTSKSSAGMAVESFHVVDGCSFVNEPIFRKSPGTAEREDQFPVGSDAQERPGSGAERVVKLESLTVPFRHILNHRNV